MVNRHCNDRITAADTSNPLQCRVRIIVLPQNRHYINYTPSTPEAYETEGL